MTKPGMDLNEAGMVIARAITPDYHKAMRIPLRRGRLFNAADRKDARQVVILSESTARRSTSPPRIRSAGRCTSITIASSSASSATCTSWASRSTRGSRRTFR